MAPRNRGGQGSYAGSGRRAANDKGALPYDPPQDYEKSRPTFCLQHLHPEFNVKNSGMSKEGQAAFAQKLESLASLTWEQIKRAHHHKQGFELIPIEQLSISVPDTFEGEDRVMVFRYHGMLPMAGVRRGATLHLVALERSFGDLYDHGD